jgi:hypothetical protein
MSRRSAGLQLLAGSLLLAACASAASSGGGAGPSPEAKETEPDAPTTGRGPSVSYREVRGAGFRVERHDSLTLQYPGGATQEQNRVRVALVHLTVAASPQPGTYRVTIVLDSLQAWENGVPAAPDSVAGVGGTIWSATLTESGVLSPLKADRPSTLGDELGGQLRLLFPTLPAGGTREGMEWTDTTQYQVVADAFPGTERSVTTYRATDTEASGTDERKGIAIESTGSYSRTGARHQADQELQMTASGSRRGVHRLGLDGVLQSAQGSDAGEMTISVPALGQTVPVKQSGSYSIISLSPSSR